MMSSIKSQGLLEEFKRSPSPVQQRTRSPSPAVKTRVDNTEQRVKGSAVRDSVNYNLSSSDDEVPEQTIS